MHACFDVLRTTSKGLWPLPMSVYYRCMGVLCNNVCVELTCSILQLIDLTTPDCDVLVEILREVEVEVSDFIMLLYLFCLA
ncbi:hypothetical protein AHF37_10285 [Paragonimus kellicotti]|nr:hypothetical protein AHF37_10285 [Paragonimus kellicotti]